MTIPDIFKERDGIRKLSGNAVKLYFYILMLEDKYGGAFYYSCERFTQDLNLSHNTFNKCRDELVKRGFITITSTIERERDGKFKRSVKYYVNEE